MALLREAYESLKKIVKESEDLEISLKIINHLELRDREEVLKIFEDKHSKIYDVEIKDNYLTFEQMREKLSLLDNVFGEVGLELKREKNRFEESVKILGEKFQKYQLQFQTQVQMN